MVESGISTLKPFFTPRSVAVIGASSHPQKLGYGLARNLVNSGYRGAVFFVNPKGGTLLDRKVYTDIKFLPEPVDLAVILTPAPSVPGVLEACGNAGVKAAVIASGGFGETGAAGRSLEVECIQISIRHQIRLLGPNSIGIIDTHQPIDTTFLQPPGPLPGKVAFISHSGAICAAVIDWGRRQGLGFSRMVSLGNQLDVNLSESIEAVAEDPHTRVICLYLESIRNGREFVESASNISRRKPIITQKVGRHQAGQRAAVSHTGALAGQEFAVSAAFRRASVLRAETSQEMFDWARALACSPLPKGNSAAVLTNAGGPGVTAADSLEAHGLRMAEFKSSTIEKFSHVLPAQASFNNPVDMLASATPEQYAACLQVILEDTAVQSAMVILPPPPMYSASKAAKALIPVIHDSKKPVVVVLMGGQIIQDAVELFRTANIPEYRFPEQAASTLSILCQRATNLARPDEYPVIFDDVNRKQASKIIETPLPSKTGILLPQETANRLLKAYHIPVLPIKPAASAKEAASISHKMGYPVALKINSPQITHKSDIDGVMLNVRNKQEVNAGYKRLIDCAVKQHPNAQVLGVYIQPMANAGQEVIVGGLRDAQFGPIVMFGSGGTEVEALEDVAFALAPLLDSDLKYLLENTLAGRRLSGYRDIPPADREAVEKILLRTAWLLADFPQIEEIEINPLRVFTQGSGAVSLDARVVIKSND